MPRHVAVGAAVATTKNASLDFDLEIARGDVRLEAKLSIPPGVMVLVGRSGAGKSTLLDAIAGLATPSRGSIRVGDDLWFDSRLSVNLPPESRRVGVVFQSSALFPHLSVIENVRYAFSKTISEADQKKRAKEILERFHVGDLASRRTSKLSGGETQRVALARAIARDPHVLLLDEPFSALDAPLRDALASEVAACARELSIPTLVVTHDHDDARRLGGSVIRLESGKLVSESVALRVDSPSPAS